MNLQNIFPEDIALLNLTRQRILMILFPENKTLSRIVKDINRALPTIFESIELLEKRELVKKDENKVYSLTKKGIIISSFLLKLNREKRSSLLEHSDNKRDN